MATQHSHYVHVRGTACGVTSGLTRGQSEMWARDPHWTDMAPCRGCGTGVPVGDLDWDDGTAVGS